MTNIKKKTMDLQFGGIQETALIPLAIKASETARPIARIKALKKWEKTVFLVTRKADET